VGIVQLFGQDGGESVRNESDDAANSHRRSLTKECILTVRIGAVPTRRGRLRLQQSDLGSEMIPGDRFSIPTIGGYTPLTENIRCLGGRTVDGEYLMMGGTAVDGDYLMDARATC
jgi:hypothetical protein